MDGISKPSINLGSYNMYCKNLKKPYGSRLMGKSFILVEAFSQTICLFRV